MKPSVVVQKAEEASNQTKANLRREISLSVSLWRGVRRASHTHSRGGTSERWEVVVEMEKDGHQGRWGEVSGQGEK